MRTVSESTRVGRRSVVAFVVGVVGCGRAAIATAPIEPPTAPSDASAPPEASSKGSATSASRLVLAWHDLSVFHGDGERIAFRSDGYALYERMRRDGLLRWEGPMDADVATRMRAVAARFAAERVEVPSRMGIPDEVRVTAHFRDGRGALGEIGLWADDVGRLPPGHAIHELRDLVRVAAAALTKGRPGAPKSPEDAGARWPDVVAS
ncbi:MAG: hypothetical protein U0183_25830 [Polyangiaceae bacterium]